MWINFADNTSAINLVQNSYLKQFGAYIDKTGSTSPAQEAVNQSVTSGLKDIGVIWNVVIYINEHQY